MPLSPTSFLRLEARLKQALATGYFSNMVLQHSPLGTVGAASASANTLRFGGLAWGGSASAYWQCNLSDLYNLDISGMHVFILNFGFLMIFYWLTCSYFLPLALVYNSRSGTLRVLEIYIYAL
jgi:hypothetical protein